MLSEGRFTLLLMEICCWMARIQPWNPRNESGEEKEGEKIEKKTGRYGLVCNQLVLLAGSEKLL